MKFPRLFRKRKKYFDRPLGVVPAHEGTFFYYKKPNCRIYYKQTGADGVAEKKSHPVTFVKKYGRRFHRKHIVSIQPLGQEIQMGREGYIVTTKKKNIVRTFVCSTALGDKKVFRYERDFICKGGVVAPVYGFKQRGFFFLYSTLGHSLHVHTTKLWKLFSTTESIAVHPSDDAGTVFGAVAFERGVMVFSDQSRVLKSGTHVKIVGTLCSLDDPHTALSSFGEFVVLDTFIADKQLYAFSYKQTGRHIDIYMYDKVDFRMYALAYELPLLPERANRYAEIVVRSPINPLISPVMGHEFESLGALNPAAWCDGDTTHLIYRAIAHDGISRLSYARTHSGISVDEKSDGPVFSLAEPRSGVADKNKIYSRVMYPSGGSWGGCEDPRMVVIDDTVYVTFNAFYSWEYIRVGYITLALSDFLAGNWGWSEPKYISPANEINKNWVLFPERINGKVALLHSIWPKIGIEYVDNLEDIVNAKVVVPKYWHGAAKYAGMPDSWVPMFEGTPGFKWVDPVALTEGAWSAYPGGSWDTWIRSSGPPPFKTDRGWLVLYHAMDKRFPHIGYKLGAMLLDLDNPEKIIAKAKSPILEPDMWYENDWKPGVVYSCGAVEKNGTLYIYYGGGDKYVCVATADLGKLVDTILEENT